MKKLMIVAAITLILGVAPAMAGEGNGEPFSNNAGVITLNRVPVRVATDTGSQSYPSVLGSAGNNLTNLAGDILPTDGSEGAVQTANSLPEHFEDGTVVYAQAKQVQTWMLAHAARHATSYASIAAPSAPR